jgi:hypothetical protein
MPPSLQPDIRCRRSEPGSHQIWATAQGCRIVSASHRGVSAPYVAASRDTRREENEKLFRLGNERLSEAVDGRVPEDARVPFLCECADEFCDGKVELVRARWASIAAKRNHFVMVRGHPRSEGEVVVGEVDAYDVVRKPD